MKVLIWIGCFFIATILNVLLGYATGIKAGYLLFYLAVFYTSKKLCALWDEHKKKQNKVKLTALGEFCKNCGQPLVEEGAFCRKCGTQKTNDDFNNGKFCCKCGACIMHDKNNCHRCFTKIDPKE